MKKLSLLLGFICGALLANCGQDPATRHGTSLYVIAYFRTDGANDVRSLYFSGQTPAGNDLFEASYRPMTPAAMSLTSPQRVRVFLGDELDGEKVTLTLYAVDEQGTYVQFGFARAKVEKGREVSVKVEMDRFSGSGSDGGAIDAGEEPDAGFFDAGSFDGGKLVDGGAAPCACDGGCCVPGNSSCFIAIRKTFDAGAGVAPVVLSFNLCGASGAFCSLAICDASRTNTCQNGVCSCGKSGLACPNGTRCSVDTAGAGKCICDTFSQCAGCCGSGGSVCLSGQAMGQVACGSAGQTCQPCGAASSGGTVTNLTDGGPIVCQQATTSVPPVDQNGVCSTSTQCFGCTGANQCCSGMGCGASAWPRCRKLNANVCVACDLLRTDSCSATTNSGCTCGKDGHCSGSQYCDRSPPTARCVGF